MKLGLWEQQLRANGFIYFPKLSVQSEINDLSKYSIRIWYLKFECEGRFEKILRGSAHIFPYFQGHFPLVLHPYQDNTWKVVD